MKTNWRDLLNKLAPDSKFGAPATQDQIALLESTLGDTLPDDLRELLQGSNGIRGPYDLGLVWSVEEIGRNNLVFRQTPIFRQTYMPFDHLIFFADAGNGDQFAFAILDGLVQRTDIYAWDHEDDSRRWVAPSLEKYLEWWLSGEIKL